MIEAILAYIVEWLVWIGDRIVVWMMGIIDKLIIWMTTAFQAVMDWMISIFETIYTWIQSIVDGLKAYFEAVLTVIEDVVIAIWTKFEEMTTAVVDYIKTFITDTLAEIKMFVDSIISGVSNWFDTVGQGIIDLINRGINVIADVATRVKNSLLSWIDEIFKAVALAFQTTLTKINTGLEAFLGGAGSFIAAIETRLSQLKEAFGEAAVKVAQGISDLGEEYLSPIRDQIQDFIKDMTGEIDPKQTAQFINKVEKLALGEAKPQEYHKFIADEWMKGVPEKGLLANVFFTVIGYLGGVMLIAQLTGISCQVSLQEYAKMFPFQLFTPPEVQAAWRRGILPTDKAIDIIRRHGYTEENANIVLKLSDQVPQEGDLLVLYHRGLISEEDLNDALHQRGYDTYYRERMRTASFLIPPITDLITMAVREAFSPEVAERFGQYEDYPGDLTAWAGKQALSEEWSKRYWAAHWALPSPQQGFEMLHRGVIKEDDLDLLLRALDVMPFWRERLTQIAFTPYTRIDIRRMHRVGVLSDAEVEKSYRDLGYDEAKAKTMTDFVLLLNAPDPADNEVALKELSRSNIVNFYSDGLLEKAKALELLIGLGYTENAAMLYLDSTDLDEERKNRKEEVSLILSLAKAGAIDFNTAEDRLRRIGLETAEINKAVVALLRERQKTVKLPSRGEAERMTKAGLITNKEYKEFLQVLGYSDKWVDGYMGLLTESSEA